MDTVNDFELKQRKYIPVFPKANGKTTVYIEGYPCEDDEPMSATDFHGEQIITLAEQFKRYFAINELVHIAVDSFIYYSEGDITKCVAPDIHIVFGVAKYPLRRSFYTWAEGTAPVAVFEFLSDATARQDRNEKVGVYLNDIGVQEYFIHQPELKKPAEFRGWRQDPSGGIVEMEPDPQGDLFSEALNLYFRWEEQHHTHVRLLRPYLPDGTPITTSMEEQHLKEAAEARAEEEAHLKEAAEARAEEEAHLRQDAEKLAAAEAQRRKDAEAELEKLRTQLANLQRQ